MCGRTLDGALNGTAVVGEGTRHQGLPVVATAARIDALGWTVFAEESLDEAFLPVYASIARSVVLVLFGVAAAIGASLLPGEKHGAADPRNRKAGAATR